MQDGPRFLARLAAVTGAAALLIMLWQSWPHVQAQILARQAEPRAVTPRGDLAEDERSTVALFEAARPAVVFIATTERVINPWTRNPLQVPRGTGTGFVWDRLGHIVTNHHVIAGASSATVRLADGRAYNAALVGASPAHDLAVLRIGIGAFRPEPLPIGTSHDLRVGQKVFAIGNPFGLDWTLTTGIVSALNRELPGEAGAVMEGLIQTDAAINPGNSGGPLLDSAGRVIGVNTAIFSPSGAYAGIGFAVPVDTVNRVVPRLIAAGRYLRPTLGVRVEQQINAALAARLGIEGVFVLDVEPGSAAEKAGIRPGRLTREGGFAPGDVILALGGRPLRGVPDLLAALDRLEPGAEVTLTLLREGRRIELPVVLDAGR
ncbi:PDZ domain-containing protein [Roseomonas alkaliterrae]|uniref:S1-C subfamily serine protease n=1 Tax=Neoroseomonas alkaliterrae TaxID=1452450 RepID=A0A840XWL8_9PROT|nr:trypsin-like peptidase domain-containing protein [Neoroseomonas alkaliterrae]MBB5691560.1 S1-C subfamily serine protease [Neoroseomonas alkaliterrae]MBR0678112.1 PDZ domain-containing protein [Neoroseomonas alkaliterrae]